MNKNRKKVIFHYFTKLFVIIFDLNSIRNSKQKRQIKTVYREGMSILYFGDFLFCFHHEIPGKWLADQTADLFKSL